MATGSRIDMKDYVFWNLKTGPGSVQEIGTILSMNNFHGFTELKVIRLEQERWHVVCSGFQQ